jgi:hypothetical protein
MRDKNLKETLFHRLNVNVMGEGATTLVFVHGYGCKQLMWQQLAGRMPAARQIAAPTEWPISTVGPPFCNADTTCSTSSAWASRLS